MSGSTPPLRLAWNLYGRSADDIAIAAPPGFPAMPPWSSSTGRGVRVCVVDSGIQPDHPMIGPIQGSYAVQGTGDSLRVEEADAGDDFGHGTACASIIRQLAADCELVSVRVLGRGGAGTGAALLVGLRWAIEQNFDLVNLSLSTTRPEFDMVLRGLADEAYFRRTVLVSSAHNTPVESYPWRYSSVISVGSHESPDPGLLLANPEPPVEFFARGRAVPVAGLGGTMTRNTGNSFATPHVTGRCAKILSVCPGLTPFQLKSLLYLTADNVRGGE